MTPEQIEAIAAQYQGKTVDEVFTDKRVLIHEHPIDVGAYQLHIDRPLAGVGGKMPRWRVAITVLLTDGTRETLNDGIAHAPWSALHGVVMESLGVMAIYVEQGRTRLVKARRQGMRAV